jgi:hypothetical protein
MREGFDWGRKINGVMCCNYCEKELEITMQRKKEVCYKPCDCWKSITDFIGGADYDI